MVGVDVPAARLLSLVVKGPAGGLEALLRVPAEPRGAAVVAHPHPLHGGTMNTKVVHRAAKLLADRFQLLTLRFNFRGVGASAGTHDDGRGEVEDLVAAATDVRSRMPQGPLVVGGFSFGSVCALKAAPLLEPQVLFLIGVPMDGFPPDANLSRRRVVWIQGELDAFSPVERARALAARFDVELLVVPGADHFFTGRLDVFEDAAGAALEKDL